MGMDALFVDLARDFYLSGKTAWADSATLAKIRENVIFLEHNLIGQHARDIVMETLDGQPFRLYQQKSKYTILVFLNPTVPIAMSSYPVFTRKFIFPSGKRGSKWSPVIPWTIRMIGSNLLKNTRFTTGSMFGMSTICQGSKSFMIPVPLLRSICWTKTKR